MVAHNRTLIRILLIACALMSRSTSALAFQEPSVLEQFGRMLGGALRGEPLNPPMMVPMEAFNDAPAARELPESEREEFRKRITAYSNAMSHWVITVCEIPEGEHAKVKEVFDNGVKQHIEKFEKPQPIDPGRNQNSFPTTFPLLFTLTKAPAATFRDSVLTQLKETILSEQQKQKLEEALKERQEFRTRAIAGFLTNLLDRDLYLSEQQRLEMVEKILSSKVPVTTTFYSFQPQAYYLPYEGISLLLSRISARDLLGPVQRKRLTDLTGGDPNNNIVFQAADGIESWHNQMNQLAKKQREMFLRAAAVRVVWLEAELKLTPEQVATLNNASKGAAVRAVNDWKEQTQQTLDQMEQQMAQMGGNFGFGAQSMDGTAVDSNEIWTDNLKEVTQGKATDRLKARTSQQAEIISLSLIALFDDELWLTPKQRTDLQPIFAKSLPKTREPVRYYEYIRDVIYFAFPLFKSDKAEREAILSETQRNVWAELESFYNYQKSNNYVQIQLRNNHGSFGFMLNE